MSAGAALESAGEGADGAFSNVSLQVRPMRCGGATAPEPSRGTSWVGIALCTADDHPVTGIRYRIEFEEGAPVEGRIGPDGVRVDGVDPGRCVVSFPDLDAGSWGDGAKRATPAEAATRAKTHTVGHRECLASIAMAHGFRWQSLWDHPENRDLKAARKSPFVLAPGDVVHIPARQRGAEEVATGSRHTFRIEGGPARLRLCLRAQGKPLAGQPYLLEFDGQSLRGTTDARGMIDQLVPPDMPAALLTVGDEETPRVYEIAPRALRPDSMTEGLQERLASLGYYRGPIHGQDDAPTRAALEHFGRDHGLDSLEAARAELVDIHRGAA